MPLMKLNILIPHYNEPNSIVQKLLDSISLQRGIDFKELEIFICNDGFDHYINRKFDGQSVLKFERDQKSISSSTWLAGKEYPFVVNEINIPKKNISAVRNALLDKANADYIMWCDCDDMFIDSLGIKKIFDTIDQTPFDELNCTFLEECYDKVNKRFLYIERKNDLIFIHGKVFNRKFLLENKIRWDENLAVHEDSYFNLLSSTLAKNPRYMPTPYYLWCWNEKSVSRKDPLYVVNTYNYLLESATDLVNELLNRGLQKEATQFFLINLFQTYYLLTGIYTKEPKLADKLNKLNKLAKDYYNKFKHLVHGYPLAEFNQLKLQMLTGAIQKDWYLETITFEDWTKKIEKL